MGVKKKKKVTEVVKNNFKNEKAPGGGVFLTQILKKRYGGPIVLEQSCFSFFDRLFYGGVAGWRPL